MAVVIGTNSGFVASAPSADPAGIGVSFNNDTLATKDTSPGGSNQVTELGWYESRASGAPAKNYNMGIYSHDAGNDRPNALIDTESSGSSTTVDTAGWYTYAGLTTAITASTTYWVAVGIPAGGGNSFFDYSGSGSFKYDRLDNVGIPLTDPWGVSDSSDTRALAMYALYAAVGGANPKGPLGMPFAGPFGGPI